MNATKIKLFVLPAIVALAAGVFVMDLLTPRGYVDWAWYLLLMLFSAYVGGRYIYFLLSRGEQNRTSCVVSKTGLCLLARPVFEEGERSDARRKDGTCQQVPAYPPRL